MKVSRVVQMGMAIQDSWIGFQSYFFHSQSKDDECLTQLVSISSVKITPDLLEARVYLSFFQVKDAKAALKKIGERNWEIKKELASRVRHQLRNIPELKFFQDDTLDHVFKMEELFKKINEEKKDKK